MNDRLKAALLGGTIAGVLSVIPFISICSCLWAIGGGLLAGFIYIRGSALPVTVGGGATVGALSGVVGAIIYLIVHLLITLVFGAAVGLDEQLRRSGIELPLSGMVLILISAIIGAIFIVGLSTVGGLIAVPIFEKRKGENIPPPPGGFGV